MNKYRFNSLLQHIYKIFVKLITNSCSFYTNMINIAEGSSSHPTMSAIDHLSKIWFVEASQMKVTWYFNYQMFRKVLVCSFYRKFQLKILLFGMWRDEVVQMISRGMRKATLCKTLTYLERAESPLSPRYHWLQSVTCAYSFVSLTEEGTFLCCVEVGFNFFVFPVSGQTT